MGPIGACASAAPGVPPPGSWRVPRCACPGARAARTGGYRVPPPGGAAGGGLPGRPCQPPPGFPLCRRCRLSPTAPGSAAGQALRVGRVTQVPEPGPATRVPWGPGGLQASLLVRRVAPGPSSGPWESGRGGGGRGRGRGGDSEGARGRAWVVEGRGPLRDQLEGRGHRAVKRVQSCLRVDAACSQ